MQDYLIDSIGYFALMINLYSMSSNGEYRLRLYSLFANMIYIIYGVLINAIPIVVGCTIATLLHAYHLQKLPEKPIND